MLNRLVWRRLSGFESRGNATCHCPKVMVFCVFRDGDVNGREEFAMVEKDQKPVISGKEEVIDGPRTVSKLKAFWRQRGAVLSGKKPELLQAVDFWDQTSVTMLLLLLFVLSYSVPCYTRKTQMSQGQSH